ncbi:hypothetical protein BMR05_00685 [Methylococcaceae bacterium HT4]|nr:hypothetical protein BMR05_00685 [Methylococcaceae bacterium HT4]TXL19560.1 hypothetical protein BMR06_09560 [Methylococcaceae bacterium HT5]
MPCVGWNSAAFTTKRQAPVLKSRAFAIRDSCAVYQSTSRLKFTKKAGFSDRYDGGLMARINFCLLHILNYHLIAVILLFSQRKCLAGEQLQGYCFIM